MILARIGALCILTLGSTLTHAQECIDSPPVGDGWGWNGSESCRTGSAERSLGYCSLVPVNGTAACLDTYGDDQLADLVTCDDPDGDGWGWNNLQGSCRANTNLVANGSFKDGSTGWNTYLHPDSTALRPDLADLGVNTPYESNFIFSDESVYFSYYQAGTQWWHSQLFTDPIYLEGGRTYQLSFQASASSKTGNAVGSVVVENGIDYTKYLSRQDFDVYLSSGYYYAEFSVPASDSNARIAFNLGNNFGGNNSENIGSITFNDIRLITIDEVSDQPTGQQSGDDCNYSQASLYGGWGWDPVALESCPPRADEPTPVIDANCDYSSAASNGGWGWNATTMTSCAPEES